MIPLSLLAAGGASVTAPPVANPTQPQPPATTDPIIEQMRPHGKRRIIATLEVSADGTKDHTSIGAAVAAASVIQTETRAAEGVGSLTPDYWVCILAYPGTYPEKSLSLGPAVSVHGVGPGVEIVEKQNTDGTGLTTDWSGDVIAGHGFWEGITFRQPNSDPAVNLRGKYLLHNIVGGDFASVFIGCTFIEENPNANAVWGQNAATGCNVTFYSCTWSNPAHTSNHVLYAVGTINYINVQGDYGTLSGSGADPAIDHVWVDALTDFPGGVSVSANASLHAPEVTAATLTYTGSNRDYRTDWPTPTGGLTPDNWTYWYG